MNLIQTLTQHFGYDPLAVIDPDTQNVVHKSGEADLHRFSQAAIPAVLVGLHRLVGSDAGAKAILYPNTSTNWVSTIFGEDAPKVLQLINDYSGFDQEGTEDKLNAIAGKAVSVIREAAASPQDPIAVKAVVESQLEDILAYLPPSLHLGELLDLNTLGEHIE